MNRILTEVVGFYEFHARHGVVVARALVDERRTGRGSFKPFLHGIAPSRPRGRVGRLRQERRLPQTLTVKQVAAFLAAQGRLRDRFLFALLTGTGMRIGQALGLRHSDVVSHQRRIEILAREDNANRARGKRGRGWVPITSELVRLHADYMHEEYRDLDSDYVFGNLWAGRIGHAMSYAAVDEVVRRTRRRIGFHFTAHQLRHTYAPAARRGGVPVEIVSRLPTHRSVQTTFTCTPPPRTCAPSSSAPASSTTYAPRVWPWCRARCPTIGRAAGSRCCARACGRSSGSRYTSPSPATRVLFGPSCVVAGSMARGLRRADGLRGHLCDGHARMRRSDGQPPQAGWLKDGARELRPRRPVATCAATACPRSVH